jgi:hypothetical protein
MNSRFPQQTRFLAAAAALAFISSGCGGDSGSGDDPGRPDAGGGGRADAGPDADGFVPVLTIDWELPPPSGPSPDVYWCASYTPTQDIVITAFRDLSPSGTHHAVLSLGPGGPADNPGFACQFFNNHDTLLFASGVGSDDFVFPDGVGIRVPAGRQLFLNVHLFNPTDGVLRGTSGVAIKSAPAVDTEAEFTFAGTIAINIPDGSTGHTETGSCTVAADATILNWWPHMHQLGRHMKVAVNGDLVHDEPFVFTEQKNYPTTLAVSQGDQIQVTCSYDNHTGSPVGFGDSSNQEMCFVGFYRYPKAGEDYCGIPF